MEELGLDIPTISLSLKAVFQIAFLIVLGLYAIFSAIFYYHWQTYSTDGKVYALTLTLYFLTTIPLLIVAGLMFFLI